MGTNYYVVKKEPTVLSPIHIGKSSIGCRFLFHMVCSFENYISDEPLNTFPQWKKFLEEQTSNGNIIIMNEYDEVVELDYLLKLIESKQSVNNPDDFTYADNIDGYRSGVLLECCLAVASHACKSKKLSLWGFPFTGIY